MTRGIRSVSSIVAGLVLAAGLVACGGEYPLEEEQAEQAMINTGGGGLGYTCTTTSGGTTCKCDMNQGDDSHADTCKGFRARCHDMGATIKCELPPTGPAWCTCSFGAARIGSTGRIFSGGASSAAP